MSEAFDRYREVTEELSNARKAALDVISEIEEVARHLSEEGWRSICIVQSPDMAAPAGVEALYVPRWPSAEELKSVLDQYQVAVAREENAWERLNEDEKRFVYRFDRSSGPVPAPRSSIVRARTARPS